MFAVLCGQCLFVRVLNLQDVGVIYKNEMAC